MQDEAHFIPRSTFCFIFRLAYILHFSRDLCCWRRESKKSEQSASPYLQSPSRSVQSLMVPLLIVVQNSDHTQHRAYVGQHATPLPTICATNCLVCRPNEAAPITASTPWSNVAKRTNILSSLSCQASSLLFYTCPALFSDLAGMYHHATKHLL